jgi:hypothetical protein
LEQREVASVLLWEQPAVAPHEAALALPEARPLVRLEAAVQLDARAVRVVPLAPLLEAVRAAAARDVAERLLVLLEVQPWVALSGRPSDLQELARLLVQR